MSQLNTFVGRLRHAMRVREMELGSPIGNKEISTKAEVSASAVSQWMHGTVNTENLKAAHVFRVARYLKVRPDWLWDNRGPMRDDAQALPAEVQGLLGDLKNAVEQEVIDLALPALQATLRAVLAAREKHNPSLLDLNAETPPIEKGSSRKRRRA